MLSAERRYQAELANSRKVAEAVRDSDWSRARELMTCRTFEGVYTLATVRRILFGCDYQLPTNEDSDSVVDMAGDDAPAATLGLCPMRQPDTGALLYRLVLTF
jgi:hypothetical protein